MTTWFFSYGSSTDPKLFEEEVGPVARAVPATIPGHRLAFADYRPEWGGGTSCILPSPDHQVIGTAYLLSDDQLASLGDHDPAYGFVDKTAEIEKASTPVKVLLPRSVGAFAAPSDAYVARIRAGLSAFYPIAEVDDYLKEALGRGAIFTSIVAQWADEAQARQEYNSLFRRLFPWKNMVRTPWGGAWATVSPQQSTELFVHDEEEIAIVVAGAGKLRVDDETRPVRKGDVVYFQPYCEHVVTNTSEQNLELLFLWWGGRDGSLWAGARI